MSNNWIGLSVKRGTVQFTQRFKEAQLLSKDFNKYASSETKTKVNNAIRKAVGYASVSLVPVDEEQFTKGHAYRRRIKARAEVSWNVGYASGETQREIVSSMIKGKSLNISISKDGNITIKYSLPKNVTLKLIPKTNPKYNPISRLPKSFKGSTRSNAAILALEKWFAKKKIHFNGVSGKGRYKRQAFMTYNAWAKTFKPRIMNDRALRISLNNVARDKYNEVVTKEFRTISKYMAKDLINKVFKNG